MEDPPIEQTPEEAAPTITNPEPSTSDVLAETDGWTTPSEPAPADGGGFDMVDLEDLTVEGGIGGPLNPYDEYITDCGFDDGTDLFGGSSFGDVDETTSEPFGAPSDVMPAPPSGFEDAFGGPGEVEDPISQAYRLRMEADMTEATADLTDELAQEIEERSDRAEEREERREARADELRARAREVAEEGRQERARDLRDAARRADERAEDAERLREWREARSESLRDEAETARSKAEELRSDATGLEREELFGKPWTSEDTTSEEDATVDYGSFAGPDLEAVAGPGLGTAGAAAAGAVGDAAASAFLSDAFEDVMQARPLEGPVSLADVAGKLGDQDVADVVAKISTADFGKAGVAVQSAVADALAAGGSPVDIGRQITQDLREELGDDAEEIGDAVTGALGGLLDAKQDLEEAGDELKDELSEVFDGTGDAGKIGDTLLTAIDNVMNGDSPIDAVRSALNEAGLGQYGGVAERAISVAEKIADGDFAGAAEAAGLDDELDPILGGYRAASGLAEGDYSEFGRGVAQASGYGDHVEAAERLAEGDFEGAGVAAAKAAGYDEFGAAADNLARGDLTGAAEEAARAGGYGEYYDTADRLAQGDYEGAAAGGANIAGSAVGMTGLGGSVQNVFEGNTTEGLASAALGAAGATIGGPIGAAAGQLLGGMLGGALGDLGADKAFSFAAVAVTDVAEGAAEVVVDVAEGAAEVVVDVAEGAAEVVVDVVDTAGGAVGAVIDLFDPF